MVDMIVALASNDFGRRMQVHDGSHALDAVAAGLNMVAEELALRQQRDRELAQQVSQAERLAAIGQLAAGVAHEVNNPAAFILANDAQVLENLRSIEKLVTDLSAVFPKGSAEAGAIAALLERHRVREVVAASADMLQDSLAGMERVVAIVSDLRAFSHIQTEHVEPIDLEQVINESCKLVQKQATYRARLTRRLGVLPRVNADHGRLVQVLTNLLVNAIHAISEGTPDENEIEVGAEVRGDDVCIWIRDTGEGMTADVMKRVFEPFYTTKPKESGTGLGLSIAAETIRRYGGSIGVSSIRTKGSCFTIRLPALTEGAESAEPAPELVPVPPTKARSARARILVIDDEPALLKVYARLLEGRYDVALAGGGREALAILHANGPFDAVLCDVMMPDLDGRAVYEEIARTHPELEPRVAFTSGGTYTPRTQAFLERQAHRLLAKPARKAQLEELIERLLFA
jgi:signal transduction histidine kinase